MKRASGITVLLVFLCLPGWQPAASAAELQSRHARIQYDDREALRDFNYELYMGRLKNQVPKGDTIEQEVAAKIDFIVNRVMQVLDMYRHNLKFTIVVRRSKSEVKQDFKRLYNVNVNYIAFYAPSENTVFFAADKAQLKVVAHEIGHVVAENYFTVSPPPKIHEVLAQYAEKHITD